MRDALLLAVVAGGLILALRYPFAGLLVWAWFSLMTPHQMAFGVFGVPLNLVIAATTIVAIALNGEASKFRLDAVSLWLLGLCGWLFVSQANSLDPANSAIYFDRFIKTLIFTLLCAQLASTRLRVHALLWMLVLSIGFFAAKGAVFTLATMGQYRVQGVPLTILEDNNHMGIAIATILPMILYLRGAATRKWVRAGLGALFVMAILSIIGTQSRAAFISLIAFGGFFWLRSQRKLAIGAALCLAVAPAIAFLPSNWTERMATITSAAEDDSFMGRVDAWIINTKFALDRPLTGAGLRNPYLPELAMKADPVRAPRAKAAHSIYFEILGGAGFVGLFFYIGLLGSAFVKMRGLEKMTPKSASDAWRPRFGYFSQMSLIVFAIGGASTSLEMWDGYLLVIALASAASRLPKVASAASQDSRRLRGGWRSLARGGLRRTSRPEFPNPI